MNNQGFLKDAGGFLLAFVVGSVSMHGILYYLITDAGDFLSSGNSFWPIEVFLIVYAAFPIITLLVWRYMYSHSQVTKHVDKSSTFYKRYKWIEISSFIALALGVICYWFFVITLFNDNVSNKFLEYAIYLSIAGLLGFIALFVLLIIERWRPTGALKLYKPIENNPNYHKFKNAYNEFYMLMGLWIIATTVIACVLITPIANNKIEAIKEDVSCSLKDYNQKIEKVDKLIKLQKEVSNQLLMKPFVITKKKENLEKIAQNIATIEKKLSKKTDKNNGNTLSVWDSLKQEIEKVEFKNNELVETTSWVASLNTKLNLVKKNYEDKVAENLYAILVNVQYYYVVLIIVLLFYAIINWFVLSHINRLILFKNGKKEPPTPLPEIEFAKFYIMLLLVMLAPILKPLEQKDIQFNKPLWTFSQASVYNITNNNIPKNESNELPSLTINTFNWGTDTLGLYTNRKAFYNSIASIVDAASYNDTYIQCLLNELQFATDSSRKLIITAISNISTVDGGALSQRIDSIINVVTFKNVFDDTTKNLRTSIATNSTSTAENSTSIGANQVLIDKSDSLIKGNNNLIKTNLDYISAIDTLSGTNHIKK